jgi:hypothetical protein
MEMPKFCRCRSIADTESNEDIQAEILTNGPVKTQTLAKDIKNEETIKKTIENVQFKDTSNFVSLYCFQNRTN